MMSQFEIIEGNAIVNDRLCDSVLTHSPTGAEIWLHIDRETRELLLAERIDGEWHELDIEQAEADYSDVLYAAR